ncbi:MAG: hypothetical protein RIR90_571 [Bacteroidota bacterium]|jgi:hypothetical protein
MSFFDMVQMYCPNAAGSEPVQVNYNLFATKLRNIVYLRSTMGFKINWDALGISASLACAIHCAVLPLVMSSLPIFGMNIIDNIRFEYFMIFLALGVGVYSLYHGWKKHHHSFLPIGLFVAGIALLFAKQIWHQWQLWFLIPAVVLIVLAHYINYQACRVHDHAHADDCNH